MMCLYIDLKAAFETFLCRGEAKRGCSAQVTITTIIVITSYMDRGRRATTYMMGLFSLQLSMFLCTLWFRKISDAFYGVRDSYI